MSAHPFTTAAKALAASFPDYTGPVPSSAEHLVHDGFVFAKDMADFCDEVYCVIYGDNAVSAVCAVCRTTDDVDQVGEHFLCGGCEDLEKLECDLCERVFDSDAPGARVPYGCGLGPYNNPCHKKCTKCPGCASIEWTNPVSECCGTCECSDCDESETESESDESESEYESDAEEDTRKRGREGDDGATEPPAKRRRPCPGSDRPSSPCYCPDCVDCAQVIN